MMVKAVSAFPLLLMAAAVQAPYPKPPEHFVDRGACPGECCTYASWHARETTHLYEKPRQGASIVATVEAGAAVEAETGEVHTRAGKFVVRRESPPYKAGDIIWVYTYLGEGAFKIWRAGDIVADDISVMPKHPNPDDWGYFERPPSSVWWVRLRMSDGRKGWTNKPERFSGTHTCG